MSDTPPPPKAPPILFDRTQQVIAQLETELGEPLITYWNSSNGAICGNDVIGLYGILQSIGQVERLSLFIKSDGGSGQGCSTLLKSPAERWSGMRRRAILGRTLM